MQTEQLFFVFLMSIGAAFVQRVAGFGYGIFIMTVLPYLMPSYAEATTLSGTLAMLTSLLIVIRHRQYLRWSQLAVLLPVFVVVSFLTIEFAAGLADAVLQKILGVMLIVASLWFGFFEGRVRIRPNLPTQLSLGSLSGIMGGLFGMQGPPVVLYFVETTQTKEQYLVTAQTYFFVGNLFMTVVRASHGYLTSAVVNCWTVGVIAVFIGTAVGNLTFRYISRNLLKKIIYIYMALSGILCFC